MSIYDSSFSREFKQLLTILSPRLNTEVVFFFKYKRRINLRRPQLLDEKIQWLKLNRYLGNPVITQCADKYRVRDYLKEHGCGDILNELYYAWDDVDEIDWDKLPQKFVIKWNFGCGENLIVHDKSKLDIPAAIKKLKAWQRESKTFYLTYSEMQYRDIVPKLICEKYIETDDGQLPVDYKFYCCDGKADAVMLCTERETGNPKYYFFSKDWHLRRYNKLGASLPADFTIPKPEGIDRLFEYAERLAKPFPFVRVDLYLEHGQIIFGELTFTPCGGYDLNFLPQARLDLGNKIDLDYKYEEGTEK